MIDIKYGRKRSGIQEELNSKIEEWIKTIEHPELQKLIKDNAIITGGCIASMLLGEPVNDFDIYFKNLDTAFAVAEYYVEAFTELRGLSNFYINVNTQNHVNIRNETETRVIITNGDDPYFTKTNSSEQNWYASSNDKKLYIPINLSQNAITLTDQIQIVIRFYGNPDQIHDSYDFAHAMCYYDYLNQELTLPPTALECLLSRTLLYKGSLYPIASMFRVKKFLNRGWRISAGQMLKIMWQINELNLSDMSILKDQLVGVDVAYLNELQEKLATLEPDTTVDSTLVGKLIDEIFHE